MPITDYFHEQGNSYKDKPFLRHQRKFIILGSMLLVYNLVGGSVPEKISFQGASADISRPEWLGYIVYCILIYFGFRFYQYSPSFDWVHRKLASEYNITLFKSDAYKEYFKSILVTKLENSEKGKLREYPAPSLQGSFLSKTMRWTARRWIYENNIHIPSDEIFIVLDSKTILPIQIKSLIRMVLTSDLIWEIYLPYLIALFSIIFIYAI